MLDGFVQDQSRHRRWGRRIRPELHECDRLVGLNRILRRGSGWRVGRSGLDGFTLGCRGGRSGCNLRSSPKATVAGLSRLALIIESRKGHPSLPRSFRSYRWPPACDCHRSDRVFAVSTGRRPNPWTIQSDGVSQSGTRVWDTGSWISSSSKLAPHALQPRQAPHRTLASG
jgi:hypothetical protein